VIAVMNSFATLPDLLRISVATPDATTAFDLEKRLAHLHPTAIERNGTWEVELEADEPRVDEVDAVVRNWLTDEGLRATTVSIDGRHHRVHARH
jgi:hypothetical protein